MQISKQLKIYSALLLFMTIVVSTVASVGTSYARFVYTGEQQIVFHQIEETEIESNIMFPQGCTVVLEEWNLNDTCAAQIITASFSGKEGKGKIASSIPQEYSGYYTVYITDADGEVITENDEILVDSEGTDIKITVTPVKETLDMLTSAVLAEALLTFTELTEITAEDGTVTVSEGNEMTGTLKWDIIPLDEPVSAIPSIPTATVTEITNEDLTFALNFKADEATDAQLNYYGSWYADFELKVNKDVTFNADGSADGWLSGQYDAWSKNWVNVPFENVTLPADTTLKIMEYAAELMGQPGLKYTYAEVYEGVKEFNCGVFFSSEYLVANPDLEVTLELRMYNPENESESYVIGETYTFTIKTPDIPTATVTEINEEDLTFALNFKTDEVSTLQLDYYGSWYADFELKVNKDVTFNADGSADGWLSGQYDAWSENWVNVPFENVTLPADTTLKIMEYAAELMGQPGLKYTYAEVYEGIKEFNCGVFFSSEYLVANPDLEVTLELRMYNPENESESYVIGETYSFKAKDLDITTEEYEQEQSDESTAVCEICGSEEHTADNHIAEETVVCEICGATDHTTENCTVEEEIQETEAMYYSTVYTVKDMQLKSVILNAKAENIKEYPMLLAGETLVTTLVETPEISLTTSVTEDNTEISSETVFAANLSVIHDTDIIIYTYITYPEGTESIEIAESENSDETDSVKVGGLIKYSQVHTEEMIYVLPFGQSFTIETDPLAAGTLSLKIVAPGAYVVSEETEGETESSVITEEIIYTSQDIKLNFNDGTTVLTTSENICCMVDGSDFDSIAPLTAILSATEPVSIKTIPVKDGNPVCTVEYYKNGTYISADSEDFSIEFDKKTNNLQIDVGEYYPQAGIYRVCQQLQQDNELSAYYKIFFVNYR